MISNVKRGFTLMEILIVIAIIALVMGIFLPNFNAIRIKSRDQARKAGVKAIVEALELYKLNQNPPRYPASTVVMSLTPGESWTQGGIVYMNKFPKDPMYEVDPTKFIFRYSQGSDTLNYLVGTCLEDASDPEGKDSPDISVLNAQDCDSESWYYKYAP